MTKLKRIFLAMLVVILLSVTVVYATQDNVIVIGDDDDLTGNIVDTNPPTTINPTENTQTDTNTSTYNNVTNNLPQTGENDYIMVLAIGLFAVSAVYAYKKVRDYKNI